MRSSSLLYCIAPRIWLAWGSADHSKSESWLEVLDNGESTVQSINSTSNHASEYIQAVLPRNVHDALEDTLYFESLQITIPASDELTSHNEEGSSDANSIPVKTEEKRGALFLSLPKSTQPYQDDDSALNDPTNANQNLPWPSSISSSCDDFPSSNRLPVPSHAVDSDLNNTQHPSEADLRSRKAEHARNHNRSNKNQSRQWINMSDHIWGLGVICAGLMTLSPARQRLRSRGGKAIRVWECDYCSDANMGVWVDTCLHCWMRDAMSTVLQIQAAASRDIQMQKWRDDFLEDCSNNYETMETLEQSSPRLTQSSPFLHFDPETGSFSPVLEESNYETEFHESQWFQPDEFMHLRGGLRSSACSVDMDSTSRTPSIQGEDATSTRQPIHKVQKMDLNMASEMAPYATGGIEFFPESRTSTFPEERWSHLVIDQDENAGLVPSETPLLGTGPRISEEPNAEITESSLDSAMVMVDDSDTEMSYSEETQSALVSTPSQLADTSSQTSDSDIEMSEMVCEMTLSTSETDRSAEYQGTHLSNTQDLFQLSPKLPGHGEQDPKQAHHVFNSICLSNDQTLPRDRHSANPQCFPCPQCPLTFRRACDFTKHFRKHTKPVECPIANCQMKFSTTRDLERHQHSRHPSEYGRTKIPCDGPGCGKVFSRKDHMLRHKKKAHSS